MTVSAPLEIALIGASVTVIGYFLSNALERRRTQRLREMEFRLDRYKEFLLAYSELAGDPRFETWLRFTNGVNVILLIGSASLLHAVRELVDNFNDEKGTLENQRQIMHRIVYRMRGDLNAHDSKQLIGFEFPIIVPAVSPGAKSGN
jgi:hypothetical protein